MTRPSPLFEAPRTWNPQVARFALDLIMRLCSQVNVPSVMFIPPELTAVTVLGAAANGSVLADTTGVMWVTFRGVWTVTDMLIIFNARKLPR